MRECSWDREPNSLHSRSSEENTFANIGIFFTSEYLIFFHSYKRESRYCFVFDKTFFLLEKSFNSWIFLHFWQYYLFPAQSFNLMKAVFLLGNLKQRRNVLMGKKKNHHRITGCIFFCHCKNVWKISSKIIQAQPFCASILKQDYWIFFVVAGLYFLLKTVACTFQN